MKQIRVTTPKAFSSQDRVTKDEPLMGVTIFACVSAAIVLAMFLLPRGDRRDRWRDYTVQPMVPHEAPMNRIEQKAGRITARPRI